MIPLYLYNTETRTKQVVTPSYGDKILMYTCGPTVYNYAHIGNFRTYVFEDLLRRTIRFFGMKIEQAMNLTDVDDKTIKGTLENNVSLDIYTKPYIKAFFEDLATLGIEKVEHYPAATDYIQEMIAMTQRLLDKGIAYVGEGGSVYFSIASFPSYGRLSHLSIESLKPGASGDVADEYDKEQASDFVLWKAYDPERDGSVYWDSPFGVGRPGWHIECSAMATKLLGESIDIHVGGVDNMFPHHENEIAQCEGCSGKMFVKHWLHAEHLLVDHKKMSKSLGNFYTLRDLLQKGYTGQQVRYALMQTHYRTQLNFSFALLDAAGASLERIQNFKERMQSCEEAKESSLEAKTLLENSVTAFIEALADDLNISLALSVLFEAIREWNALCDQNKVNKEVATLILSWMEQIDQVLGIFSLSPTDIVPESVLDALEKRQQARKEKNWALADECRDFIALQGYKIEESPEGAKVKKQRGV